jgi:hypothetical protein
MGRFAPGEFEHLVPELPAAVNQALQDSIENRIQCSRPDWLLNKTLVSALTPDAGRTGKLGEQSFAAKPARSRASAGKNSRRD